jgi:hypothetical protein
VTSSHRRIGVTSLAVLSLLAVFALFNRAQKTVPPFNAAPLPKGTRTLTAAEAEDILAANFSVIRRVQQIPASVKGDYTALAGEPFEMVNPGQTMSTDLIISGVPNKKLVLVGLADQTAVLIFVQGGYASTINAAVFSHRENVGVWGAMIEDYSVHDIAALRRAVHNGRFKAWDNPK